MILIGDYIPKTNRVVLPEWMRGKCVLANLEAPIVGSSADLSPSFKVGPNLCNENLGVDPAFCRLVFNLANNHMMDYGEEGLSRTLDFLNEHGIAHCGADRSVESARAPIIVEDSGRHIAIIGCREAQFGSVNCADFGAWIEAEIRRVRPTVDFVLVSAHAALEDFPFPSPALRDLYRRFIDAGADLVHGHHSHVPQGWERHSNGLIFYGLGNFAVDPETWKLTDNLWSLVPELDFSGSRVEFTLHRCACRSESKNSIKIVDLPDSELARSDDYLTIAIRALESDSTLRGYWQEIAFRICERDYGFPLNSSGFGKVPLALGQRWAVILGALRGVIEAIVGRRLVTRRRRGEIAEFYNCLQCLSHRELIRSALGLAFNNEPDFRTPAIASDCTRLLALLSS